MAIELITDVKSLRAKFDYNPTTGVFTYKTKAARRVDIGDEAGCLNREGYRRIRFDGNTYFAHRLAWFYMTGVWPEGHIDHINGNPSDNRITNLRQASRSENLANSRVFRSGKTAPKGVRQTQTGKWSARIQKDGTSMFLGYFKTQDEAHTAYKSKALEIFGSFARLS